MVKLPMIFVNFKAFKEATGQNAVKLAKVCEKVAKDTGFTIAIAVQAADIYQVSHAVKIPVFAQHIDPINYGPFTGHNLAECVKENGAVGTMINHSEYWLDRESIRKCIGRAKEAGLKTIVCAADPETATGVAQLKPDFIVLEPPELIGGEVSVSTAEPYLIEDTIEKVKKVWNIPILCGAGIKNQRDVSIALQLGASGIVLATHVMQADRPEAVLKELVEGLKESSSKKKR
jgi:triosephosphate isomerase (TIM)